MDKEYGTLRFKVTLEELRPAVWRRIEVPASYTFWDLHVAVQDAMGWRDCHLHMFRVRNPTSGQIDEIGIPDDEAGEGDPICLPGWKVVVARYFPTIGTRGAYEYDFGDSWVHQIELAAIKKPGAGLPEMEGDGSRFWRRLLRT